MTLGDLKDSIIDWFGSGFCNLTQIPVEINNVDICYSYYPLSFWNLTIGQFIFTIFVGIILLACIASVLDEISPVTRPH